MPTYARLLSGTEYIRNDSRPTPELFKTGSVRRPPGARALRSRRSPRRREGRSPGGGTRLSIIITSPGLDSRARTALEHMLESVVSARGKVLRTNFSATSRVTRATKLKGNPESPFRVVERWAWALFLQRRHSLPQSDVLQHQVGAAPTHRPNGTDAK